MKNKEQEKAKEIYFSMLHSGRGLISDYLAQQMAKNAAGFLIDSVEEMYKKDIIDEYQKGLLQKYWKKVYYEINQL